MEKRLSIITFSKWLENSGAIFLNKPNRCYSQIGIIVEEKLFAIRWFMFVASMELSSI